MGVATPPPVIGSARVLAYATVDDTISFTGQQSLDVDGKPLGAVPCIALCEDIHHEQAGFFVAYCDENWEAIGIVPTTDPESALRQVEHYYRGISQRWTHTTVTVQQAREWIAHDSPKEVCSFCGRLSFEVARLVHGRDATICNLCLDALNTGARAES